MGIASTLLTEVFAGRPDLLPIPQSPEGDADEIQLLREILASTKVDDAQKRGETVDIAALEQALLVPPTPGEAQETWHSMRNFIAQFFAQTLGDLWGFRLYTYRKEVAGNQPTPLDSRAMVPQPANRRFTHSWQVTLAMLALTEDQVMAIFQAFAPRLEAHIKAEGPLVLHGDYAVAWQDSCLMLT